MFSSSKMLYFTKIPVRTSGLRFRFCGIIVFKGRPYKFSWTKSFGAQKDALLFFVVTLNLTVDDEYIREILFKGFVKDISISSFQLLYQFLCCNNIYKEIKANCLQKLHLSWEVKLLTPHTDKHNYGVLVLNSLK